MGASTPPAAGAVAAAGFAALFSRRRLAMVARFSSVQLLVQAVGFVAGIVLVRGMAQDGYGHYTLLVAAIGLAAVLLDLGLGTAVLALGGPHHAAPERLAALLGDAFALQRRLAAWIVPPLACGVAWTLASHGLAAGPAVGLSLLACAVAWLNARNSLWLGVVRLQGRLALQQRLDLAVNAGRAALLLALALVHLDAWVAVLALLAASAATHLLLRRSLREASVGVPLQGDGSFQAGLRGFVLRQAPNSIYYCVSAQVAVWLVGWFGGTARVAEVGALGRLTLLFTIVGAVLAAIVQPYVARPRRRGELWSAFVALHGFFAAMTLLLAGAAVALPGPLLWVLGRQYAGLTAEAPWMVLAGCLGAWSAAAYSMGAARGWVVPSRWTVPVGLGAIALGALVVDVSTVKGAFQINAAWAGAGMVLAASFVAARLRDMQEGAA